MDSNLNQIKNAIYEFIVEQESNSMFVDTDKKSTFLKINKYVFDLESFFISLRKEFNLNERIDTSIVSDNILINFDSISSKNAFKKVDYQLNFLYYLAKKHTPNIGLFELIDGFIEEFKKEFNLSDIVITSSGATRCKTNIRFALNDLRDIGMVISKDLNGNRSWAPSIMGLVVLLNIDFFKHDFSKVFGNKNFQSMQPGAIRSKGLPSYYQYDPLLIASIEKQKNPVGFYEYLSKNERYSITDDEKNILNEIISKYINFISENLEIKENGIKAANSFADKTKEFQNDVFLFEQKNIEFYSKLFMHFR